MKKYFPLILSLSFMTIVVFLWDYIKLPYNNENTTVGEFYYKKFNPLNETVRFLSFILLPCLVYLVSYIFINQKTYNFNINSNNYFLSKKEDNYYNSLNLYFFLFIVLISAEFLSLNFSNFVRAEIDVYHEGAYLVPPLNYLANKGIFTATLYDYGLIGNNLGLISNFFLGFYSIGSIKFIKLLLVYLIKFFLILISKKITADLNLNDLLKKIFFITFTFFVISLPDYNNLGMYFNFRQALYLLFILILGSTLCNNKNLNLRFFIIGTFSLISILWWTDIGAYINALIFLCIIYLLIHKEIKNILFISFGVVLSWTLFFIIMPAEENKEFLFHIAYNFSDAVQYLIGTEYVKPFSANSGRWTKALLLIYISSLMLINLNFGKKFYVNYKTKIFINLLFISGIFLFQSALSRSDTWHLKYSSGLYTLVFVLLLILFLFQRLEVNKKIKNLIKDINPPTFSKFIFLFYISISFLFFSGAFSKSDNTKIIEKIQNIINSKKNITYLVKAEDDLYLKENTKSVLRYYNEISKDDNCIQVFTDDAAFTYFLRKPTCTQYVFISSIVNGYTESKFINQLKLASPNIILYKSPTIFLPNYSNMPNALKFINKNYSFLENYNDYIFYKKN